MLHDNCRPHHHLPTSEIVVKLKPITNKIHAGESPMVIWQHFAVTIRPRGSHYPRSLAFVTSRRCTRATEASSVFRSPGETLLLAKNARQGGSGPLQVCFEALHVFQAHPAPLQIRACTGSSPTASIITPREII